MVEEQSYFKLFDLMVKTVHLTSHQNQVQKKSSHRFELKFQHFPCTVFILFLHASNLFFKLLQETLLDCSIQFSLASHQFELVCAKT